MIPYQKYLQVKECLATGISCREVHQIVGVARATVLSVRSGTHYWDRTSSVEMTKSATDKSAPELLMYGLIPPDTKAPAVKCPTCSAIVFPPCLACQIRALKKKLKNGTMVDQDGLAYLEEEEIEAESFGVASELAGKLAEQKD